MSKGIFILLVLGGLITSLSVSPARAREMSDFIQYQNNFEKRVSQERAAERIASIFSSTVLEKVDNVKADIKVTLDNQPDLYNREKIIVGDGPGWDVFHQRQEFAFQFVSALIASGVSETKVELIINKLASIYAMLLAEIVRGRSVESSLDEYVYETKGLLEPENISEDAQQKIINLVEEHFKELSDVLKKITTN